MAVPFPNLPPWFWRNPVSDQQPTPPSTPDAAPAPLDADTFKYPTRRNASFKKSGTADPRPASLQPVKRPTGRRRWQKNRNDLRRLDPDFDMVLVPSDGGCCMSGSDSDDSDWSVGWFEPHAPDFCSSDGESENSFAVLVPCYGSPSPDINGGRGRFTSGHEENSKSQLWAAVLSNIAKDSQTESKQYLQQWLSSLQG